VHIDPEDDQMTMPGLVLPHRQVLLPLIKQCCQELPGADQIRRIIFHYLAGQVHIEIQLPLSLIHDRTEGERLVAMYRDALQGIDAIARVDVGFVSGERG